MNTTYNNIKRTYVKPELSTIILDNQISLILSSDRVLPGNPEDNYDPENEHFTQFPFE